MIPMLASSLLSQGQPIRSEAGAPAMFPSTFSSTVLPMGLSEAIVEPKGEQKEQQGPSTLGAPEMGMMPPAGQ